MNAPEGPFVLDASAVLALIYREPGHEQVLAALPGAWVLAVNWAEVIAKLLQRHHPHPSAAAEAIRALGVEVVAFTPAQATQAGLLWQTTHAAGLSLGDRACLALATSRPDTTTLTGDRAWADLTLHTTVRLIR